ncbi:hypothetical protein CVT26_014541 [Gymnopilus dilepis]|uniref:DNA/RNA-binding protein Alba-like domain-containing protein n=1 Tax=Gymnopilus dilepis TaxID=231916 RepID=A0A409W369_9AGAR|nr:hypothetical protein CVT26_014541 [Gymnopilus dilepis]
MAQKPDRNDAKDVEMSGPESGATSPATSVAAGVAETATPSTDTVRYVRITAQGKMKTWVGNSLTFLEDLNAEKCLVLHTLPPSIDPSSTPSSLTSEPSGGKVTTKAPAITSKSASSCTSQIPRLLSVVEIIKREFMKKLEETKSTRMRGLEQYNELGNVEALGVVVSNIPAQEDANDGQEESEQEQAEKRRSEMILQAMSGKNHPRQSQTPYMRVTLSLRELPDLVERGATYQPPAVRKLSKSGKARAKKRAKKAQAAALEEAQKAIAADQPPPAQVGAAA